jgi:hypothetical protein
MAARDGFQRARGFRGRGGGTTARLDGEIDRHAALLSVVGGVIDQRRQIRSLAQPAVTTVAGSLTGKPRHLNSPQATSGQ